MNKDPYHINVEYGKDGKLYTTPYKSLGFDTIDEACDYYLEHSELIRSYKHGFERVSIDDFYY